VNIEKTQLTPRNGCGGSTNEVTAIEIGHVGQLQCAVCEFFRRDRRRACSEPWRRYAQPECDSIWSTTVPCRPGYSRNSSV